MNYRLSFVLLVMLAVVGGYVLLFELQKRPESNQAAPWFYDVSYDEIRVIEIDHDGRAEVGYDPITRSDEAFLGPWLHC